VIVIGAGIGGFTIATVLARAGLDVTVLESQVYPGGCAGTYYYQVYRFDAGGRFNISQSVYGSSSLGGLRLANMVLKKIGFNKKSANPV
jgi:phytoene dehydrogenase-like protein